MQERGCSSPIKDCFRYLDALWWADQEYLLTLTAPTFRRVHRVPRDGGKPPARCGCGAFHTARYAGLRGVPLDPASYDYAGQVAWKVAVRARREVMARGPSAP